jgi:vitamin B12 transporter
MNTLTKHFLLLVFLVAIVPAAFAQDVTPLEDVVISAYKSNILYGQSSSVSIITSRDIEQGGYRFVSDALQAVPGLTLVQTSPLGGTASVFIRGAKIGNMAVLIDGVKVNDPSSIERTFDFATLTTDSIERIEIIKGPHSSIYGSDATGGIINIVTKRGQGKPTVTLNLYGGSYYTTQQSANISGGDSYFNYSFTAGQFSAKGYSKAAKPDNATKPFDDDPFFQQYAMGKCGFSPLQSLLIDAGFTAKQSHIALDDGALTDDQNSTEKRKELSGYTHIEHTITTFWKQTITVNASQIQRKYDDFDDDGAGFDDIGQDNHYTGTIANAEWLHTFTLKDINTLIVGASYEKEYSKVQDYLASSKLTNDNATAGLFAQDHVTIANIFYCTAGVRADKNQVFGWQQSFTVSPAIVVPVVKTKLKGNWGKGYKAPSLYQIYGDGGVYVAQNKDLKTEKSIGYDIGFEQPLFDMLKIGVTYFENKYRDMIDYDSSTWPRKYINKSKVKTYGYESSVSFTPFKALTLSGGYTYLKAIDEETDKQLPRRPVHQGNGSVTFTTDKLSLSVIGTYLGKRKDSYYDSSSFSTVNVTLDGYFTVDLALQYALTPQLTVNAKAENIADKKYQQVYGYTMPGRSFYIGLKAIL